MSVKTWIFFVICCGFAVGFSPAYAIPPTDAFSIINSTSGNVTASDYNSIITFLGGSGITISPNYSLGTITFTATGSGGVNNTISSIGTQQSIVSGQILNDHQLKGIACGGDLQCSNNSTDVTISFTETGIGSVGLDDLTDVIITSPVYPSILFYDSTNWIDKVFVINTQSASNDVFVTGINNQTGVITTNTFSVNTKTCSGTDKVTAINNSTGDVTCSTDQTGGGGTPRGGYLMAHWSMSQLKSNIGTGFSNVYPQTNSNGKAIFIDTDTFTEVRLHIQWNKVGTGTQTCQVLNGATVLVSTDVVSGSNDSGFDAIPAGLLNAENQFRLQCKSTTGTDDPIFESASIWLK